MSEPTVAPQPVNWEAVRMLALTVGVRESARRMGLNEDRVRQRCTREGWLATPEARALNKIAIEQRSSLSCRHMSPTAVFQAELTQLGADSRLSIARTVAKAGKHFETMAAPEVIADAGNLKSIAQTADLVHGWKDNAPQVKIRLDVLNASAETPVFDVEAETVSGSWEEPCSDNLDDY